MNDVKVMANPAANVVSSDRLSALLQTGLHELGIAVTTEQQAQCLQYVALLNKWNRTYNLTAVRDIERMIGVHILDSLAVLPYVAATGNLLDVGAGAGLPGIPLAIMRPDLQVMMLDSLQKKTVFIRQAISELGLKNAAVVCERVENFRPATKFDTVISRAFAELSDFVHTAGHLVADSGAMLAMKGAAATAEISHFQGKNASPPKDGIHRNAAPVLVFDVLKIIDLKVPQVDGERCLVVLKSANEGTNENTQKVPKQKA